MKISKRPWLPKLPHAHDAGVEADADIDAGHTAFFPPRLHFSN
jgi:hypothetical protein